MRDTNDSLLRIVRLVLPALQQSDPVSDDSTHATLGQLLEMILATVGGDGSGWHGTIYTLDTARQQQVLRPVASIGNAKPREREDCPLDRDCPVARVAARRAPEYHQENSANGQQAHGQLTIPLVVRGTVV